MFHGRVRKLWPICWFLGQFLCEISIRWTRNQHGGVMLRLRSIFAINTLVHDLNRVTNADGNKYAKLAPIFLVCFLENGSFYVAYDNYLLIGMVVFILSYDAIVLWFITNKNCFMNKYTSLWTLRLFSNTDILTSVYITSVRFENV